MNEQQLHERLERATDHVHGGPDLQAAIRTGRARRRRTHGLAALGVAAVLAVGGVGLAAALGGSDPTVVDATPAGPAPSTSAPASPAGPAAATGTAGTEDWVPGTDIDQQLAATVATHLPELGTPDDVYPSDSHTAGPLLDASWRRAEDWQAAYTVAGHQTIVMTSSPAEPFSCDSCRTTQVAAGTVYRQSYDPGGLTWHGTWLQRPDGSTALVLESVTKGGAATLPDGPVVALLADLPFPSGA